MINVKLLEPGTRVALADGSTVEIVSNPRDGIWVFARYLAAPADRSRVGTEEMIFAQDVLETVGEAPGSPEVRPGFPGARRELGGMGGHFGAPHTG